MSHISKRDRAKARPDKRSMGSVKLSKALQYAMRDAWQGEALAKAKPTVGGTDTKHR